MFLDWILDRMDAYLAGVLSSPIEIVALGAAIAAALLTITSSFVKTMVPLRWLAVCSNFGFFTYGVLQLVDQGLIDLDTPIAEYYEYADIAYDERIVRWRVTT